VKVLEGVGEEELSRDSWELFLLWLLHCFGSSYGDELKQRFLITPSEQVKLANHISLIMDHARWNG
jgi:hypothetical protein